MHWFIYSPIKLTKIGVLTGYQHVQLEFLPNLPLTSRHDLCESLEICLFLSPSQDVIYVKSSCFSPPLRMCIDEAPNQFKPRSPQHTPINTHTHKLPPLPARVADLHLQMFVLEVKQKEGERLETRPPWLNRRSHKLRYPPSSSLTSLCFQPKHYLFITRYPKGHTTRSSCLKQVLPYFNTLFFPYSIPLRLSV